MTGQPSDLAWRKSTRSNGMNQCVEVAPLTSESVAVRDSKRPVQPNLAASRVPWATFAQATRAGRFDLA